ncbi:MAG: single-strand DNA-binding protein [Polaribacter sp.]|jgi:single-strand DNA-binding protein
MTSLRNSVKLIGHLGADPEMKRFDGGKILANLSLATSENYKNAKGEKVTTTQWHKLKVWGKTAEFLEKYTRKGSEIAIEGKLEYRNYEDKDKITRYVTEIKVNEVLLISKTNAA